MVFVDQPRYVGYSTGTGPKVHNSVDAGKDIVQFLRGFYELYPEHAARKLYITGESYGGHYLPAWANAILDFNADPSSPSPLPLAGIGIGNGCINNTVQDDSTYVAWAEDQFLIPENSGVKTQVVADEMIVEHLRYVSLTLLLLLLLLPLLLLLLLHYSRG